MPVINQHNALYDRNPSVSNQNGKEWCAPVATVSALLWLAKKYDRPKLVPFNTTTGKYYTTDEFVVYMGSVWFGTNDATGTTENNWVRFLWGYLKTTPYAWNMDVFVAPQTPALVNKIDGPNFYGHPK